MKDISDRLTTFQRMFKPEETYSGEQIRQAFFRSFVEDGHFMGLAYLWANWRLHFEVTSEELPGIILEGLNKLGKDAYEVVPGAFQITVVESNGSLEGGITIFQRESNQGMLIYRCVGYELRKMIFLGEPIGKKGYSLAK